MEHKNDEFSVELSVLAAKLKESDPVIQKYIVALKFANTRLHRKIILLEARNVMAQNKINTLEKRNSTSLKTLFDIVSE